MLNQPILSDIRTAHKRIESHINKTPVLTCTSLNSMAGANLFFKCENFQKVGAFKFRGACNAVFSLSDEEASRGVATHSSGNHAAALALAAGKRGITARIVMPSNTTKVKVDAVKGYGGIITFCEPTLESREGTTAKVIRETGAVLIHPYNDYRIIAGQGTAALEFLEEIPDLDFILAPVGGGGLLSGTAIAVKSLYSKIKVIGCEPKNADDAYRSKKAGKIIPSVNPNTIADGLRTSLGDKTFPIIRDLVDGILLATEEEIITAMRHIFERMKIVVEPSAAVPLAVLLSGQFDIAGKNVGVILSGGNVDLSRFFGEAI
jgi:threonine dehydratase